MALFIRKNPIVFASGAASSVTGTATETTLGSFTVPAGCMGLNGYVDIITLWSMTNDASAKTAIIRFGGAAGTAFLSQSIASNAAQQNFTRISNRNSLASQIGHAAGNAGFGAASSITTATIDTSADVSVLIRATLGDTADTITLERWAAQIWYVG